MTLGPLNRGDTGLPFTFQFTQSKQPFPLTNYPTTAVRLHFWQKTSGIHKLGKGTVQYVDVTNGIFQYILNHADTNMPGLWDVWGELFTAAAGSISSTNMEKLQINDRPSDYVRYGMGRLYVIKSQPVQPARVP